MAFQKYKFGPYSFISWDSSIKTEPKKENKMNMTEQEKNARLKALEESMEANRKEVAAIRNAEIIEGFVKVPDCINFWSNGDSGDSVEVIFSLDKKRKLFVQNNTVTHTSACNRIAVPCKILTTPTTKLKDECVYLLTLGVNIAGKGHYSFSNLAAYSVYCKKDNKFYSINDGNQEIRSYEVEDWDAYPVVKL